jgi:hypothetical protein
MSPTLIVKFPDACVRFAAALPDRGRGDLSRSPILRTEHVEAGRRREELQCFTEFVELELPVHPVPGPDLPTGVPGQPQAALGWDAAADDGVGRLEVRPSPWSRSAMNLTAPSSSGCRAWAATASPA